MVPTLSIRKSRSKIRFTKTDAPGTRSTKFVTLVPTVNSTTTAVSHRLFPTLVAGVYGVVRAFSGLTMTEQPLYVTRMVLVLINIPLLGLFFFCTIASVERLCRNEWARIVAAFGTCFGTMLLPFSVSLNNHLPAAAATALVMWIFVGTSERLTKSGDDTVVPVPASWFALAGLSAAFAVANELPALSMFAFWFVLFWFAEKKSSLPFLAGAAVVAIAFFGTNWLAHQSLRPPYAHRGEGAYIAELASEIRSPDAELVEEVRTALVTQGLAGDQTNISVAPSDEAKRWLVSANEHQYALIGQDEKWKLYVWDDWYEYPGTYWKEGIRQGVDKGEPSRFVYFLQMMIGHHGIFSLTPLWLLVPFGIAGGLRYGPADHRRLHWAVLLASVACISFYVARPLIDRNYGGVSICFRWLLWFAPLWIVMATPVIEKFSDTKLRRSLIYALLALSVFSASVSLETPWEHPWIYRFWEFLGWLGS